MSINPALLVAAPMLQDALIDKTGIPMANGVITCFRDNSRTTLKNWYYQSGTPGNYTYIPLPNPLTLSAAGTITDINGVDTIPFFYPFDENDQVIAQPYYITIVNAAQTNQITRANFPYNVPISNVTPTVETLENLIVNNGFWRNLQPNYINQPIVSVTLNNYAVMGSVNVVVAPSQHDGFSMPDIRFVKNNTSATDLLTFTPFPALTSPLIVQGGDIYTTPEYYINHSCTSTGTGENQKCYQFPIALHLNNLANLPFTVSIQAQWGGAGSNVIQLKLLQFTGTGTTSPDPITIAQTSITLSTTWTVYSLTDVFPSTVGLTLGEGQDDAFYLQVTMPFNAFCSINFTKPSLYLTTAAIPVNDFTTYDEVGAIIDSSRTGDIRTSINQHDKFGWVPMNNGVFGLTNPGTNSLYVRYNADTWRLFNMLWTIGQPYDSGSNFNPLFQMFTNTSGTLALTNYGASAYSDFITNSPSKALALPFSMGRVFLGSVPLADLLGANTFFNGYTVPVTASNGSPALLFTYGSGLKFGIFQGSPISFTATGGSLPGGIVANAVYYAIPLSATTFNIATTFANALSSTAIAYSSTSGSNVVANLFPTGSTEGEYAHTQLVAELASHTHPPPPQGDDFVISNFNQSQFLVASGVQVCGRVTATGFTGSSTPFNVTQPGTFMNIYIKL